MNRRGEQEEENAAELKLGSDFRGPNVDCLWNSEVVLFLETFQKAHEEADADIEMTQVFNKTFTYVKRFSRFKNKETIHEVRRQMSRRNQLDDFEVSALSNLCPETAEEAKALIPSLSAKFTEEELDGILNDLRNYSTMGA
eukprot:TRINITY_DN6635_c0_g1_i1.p1 TRINITY_DN6635_c0_g1~~TRINITY_DN6635_c0_g1_i1.p1  ORF type:complete len:141 (+),score=24.42 TRINITY_DN6635_c0_g1_i1:2-424(+)